MSDAPTRILFLANWPRPKGKGGGQYAFLRHFTRPVHLKLLGSFNIPLWTRFEKKRLKFYLLQPLVAFFLSFRYDVVLAYSAQCALPLAFFFRLFGRKKTPLVVFDVETFGRPTGGLRLALTRFACRAIDQVVYAAAGQKEFYDRQLPEVSARSIHIPIGIGEYDKHVGFDETLDSDYLIAIGRQDRAFRDWATLLSAMAPLAGRIRLVIVGRDRIDPEDRDNAPIPSHVELLPYMPIEQLADVAERARFALLPLPERNQSIGQLSVLFLMAMGKAVIASKVMGVADYIEPGRTGLFYRPGDAADLTSQIEFLLDHPEEVSAMSKNARLAALEKFNDRIMGKRWEQVIVDAVNRSRGHG